MHTQGHAILNLLFLGEPGQRKRNLWTVIGAILPDLPIFLFFVYERFYLHAPEQRIWAVDYFQPGPWQDLVSALHSFPLILIALGLALFLKREYAVVFCASLFLHSLFDFPLRGVDAYQHFFPFSSYRYHSAFSYWDPAHHGAAVAALEAVLVLLASLRIWHWPLSKLGRAALLAGDSLYLVPLAVLSKLLLLR